MGKLNREFVDTCNAHWHAGSIRHVLRVVEVLPTRRVFELCLQRFIYISIIIGHFLFGQLPRGMLRLRGLSILIVHLLCG